MVSRILTTLLITSLCLTAGATDYQIANKSSDNLQILTAKMTTADWNRSVVWLPSSSPVKNAGAANAAYVSFDKKVSSNAIQPTPSQQPSQVLTNGIYGLSFDGVDDTIYIPHSTNQWIGTNDFSLCITYLRNYSSNSMMVAKSTSGQRAFWFRLTSDNNIQFVTTTNKAAAESIVFAAYGYITNGVWQTVKVTRIDGVAKMYMNGIEIPAAGTIGGDIGAGGATGTLLIGIQDGGQKFNGLLANLEFLIGK